MKRTAALLCLLLITGSARSQETLYITDILQLGLYATEDASGQPMRNLVSGTAVSVLERIPNFARVRTPDGEEGWVKSAFLVEQKPAQLRMMEFETTIAGLEAELAQARSARDSAMSEAEALVSQAELQLAEVGADQERLARLEAENMAFTERLESYRGALPWPWVIGALVLALAAGFYVGYWWLDAAIRRRHGGFRVY